MRRWQTEVGKRRESGGEKERDINDTRFPRSANEIINKKSLLHFLSLSLTIFLAVSASFCCPLPHPSLSELCSGKRKLITAVSFPHCVQYQRAVFNARRGRSLLYHSICCWEPHRQAKPRLPLLTPFSLLPPGWALRWGVSVFRLAAISKFKFPT